MVVTSAVVLLLATTAAAQHVCQGVGFYPDPADCSTFYRCTDLWNNGQYQQYTFMCPVGTVFDDDLDVCNWPWAVPSCGVNPPTAPQPTTTTVAEATTPMQTTSAPTVAAVTDAPTTAAPETAAPTTIAPATVAQTTAPGVTDAPYTPSENSPYSCGAPGVVGYEADCQKFWLCKEEPEGSRILESLLYRCPDGYLFSSSTLRCARADDLTCLTGAADQPDARSTPVNQLTVEELDSFFTRWG